MTDDNQQNLNITEDIYDELSMIRDAARQSANLSEMELEATQVEYDEVMSS